MMLRDIFQSDGFASIHHKIVEHLDVRETISLAGVCRTLRASIHTCPAAQLRLAKALFNVKETRSPVGQSRSRRYISRELAKASLAPRHVSLFHRHLLGKHGMRSGYYMSSVSKSRPDWNDQTDAENTLWEFQSDNWAGQMFYDLIRLKSSFEDVREAGEDDETEPVVCELHTNPPLGPGVAARYRRIISRRMDWARDWDPEQDVEVIVTRMEARVPLDSAVAGECYHILRFYKLFHTSSDTYEAEPHPTAQHHSVTYPRVYGGGAMKLRLGPDGVVAICTEGVVDVYDWRRGIWLGHHAIARYYESSATSFIPYPQDVRFLTPTDLAVSHLNLVNGPQTIALEVLKFERPDTQPTYDQLVDHRLEVTHRVDYVLPEPIPFDRQRATEEQTRVDLSFLPGVQDDMLDTAADRVVGFSIGAFLDHYRMFAYALLPLSGSPLTPQSPVYESWCSPRPDGSRHGCEINAAAAQGNAMYLVRVPPEQNRPGWTRHTLERHEDARAAVTRRIILDDLGLLQSISEDDFGCSPSFAVRKGSWDVKHLFSWYVDSRRVAVPVTNGNQTLLKTSIEFAVHNDWRIGDMALDGDRLALILEPTDERLGAEHNAEAKPVILLTF